MLDKKRFARSAMVGVAMLTATCLTARAETFQEWFDIQGETRLFDFHGNDITASDALVFQLIVDAGTPTDFDGLAGWAQSGGGWGIGAEDHMYSDLRPSDFGAGDDYVAASGTWADLGGIHGVYEFTPIPYNARFYFRWFNSDAVPSTQEEFLSTQAGLIYSVPTWVSIPDDTVIPLPAQLDYADANTFGTQMAGDGWQSMPMVPEPGTFALFGLGLLTVAARRKLRKTA